MTAKVKPKSTYTPATFAEVRAMQNPTPAKIRPEALKRDWAGSVTQAEHDARAKQQWNKTGYIQTAPSPASDQWAKGGTSNGSRRKKSSGGGKQDMSPLPPHKIPVPKYSMTTGDVTQILRTQNKMKKQAYEQRQEFERTDPAFLYRRRLWDLQEAKLREEEAKYGIKESVMSRMANTTLGNVRNNMIRRMNQLRGGGQ